MLQAAATELDSGAVSGAFYDLCVTTEADFGLTEAAAQATGFESFDFRVPMRRDVLKLVRRAAFRKPGFFLTVEHFVAREGKKPTVILNVASLLAKPVAFEAVQTEFVAEYGEPNRRDLAGVGVAFASISGAVNRPATYEEAYTRHQSGEGDLVVINLNDVRTYSDVPSDTSAMSYARWIR